MLVATVLRIGLVTALGVVSPASDGNAEPFVYRIVSPSWHILLPCCLPGTGSSRCFKQEGETACWCCIGELRCWEG